MQSRNVSPQRAAARLGAAAVLAISERQVWRLLARYRDGGGGAITHRARGLPSNNRLGDGVRELAVTLIEQNYRDFGPTLAAETLAERHGLAVSRETLRHWMVEAGLWLSRRQRRQFHPPRLRRERYGELIQIDGSDHRWFEDPGDPCTLLVFIDDATGCLMHLRFVASESTFSYFEVKDTCSRMVAPSPSIRTSIPCFGLPKRRPRAARV